MMATETDPANAALDDVTEQGVRLRAIIMANCDRIPPDFGIALVNALDAYGDAWARVTQAILAHAARGGYR